MFPAASYEISAEIPCYASGAQLVKKQTGPFSYDLSVTYSYQFAPGVMFCQSLRLETFTTSISSEFLPQINLLDAAAGVVLETQIQ